MKLKTFKDQLGKEVTINFPPIKIISLVPSQTELLFDLGLSEEIIGITKFCIHPKDKFKTTTKIGGTKKIDIKKIRALNPDLIIGNKEENQKQDIETLTKEFPVWMSDIYNLKDALEMIISIGEMTNKNEEASVIKNQIKLNFQNLATKNDSLKKALYFIWESPKMVVGNQTFINEMLKYCGLTNIIEEKRYPELAQEQLKALNPEVVLLSSEPYPFKTKHVKQFQNMWPKAIIKLVDGEMFSWYGSRLLKAAFYFQKLSKSL
ncbi:ABC transporter substrate-binding protein [Pedobacter sp. SD-b]|uniref:ABC transporter substrate-binding protein n=1 Tax=Pedobacter segetis TaxID=2793069 RepID=A0ABS1BJ44_9SPHI|nr:helical backbone metal receptor [Pedobacter segetis]MBK0382918.1 ABC transporter substrate-binding protein [Pedobacter segetis]